MARKLLTEMSIVLTFISTIAHNDTLSGLRNQYVGNVQVLPLELLVV